MRTQKSGSFQSRFFFLIRPASPEYFIGLTEHIQKVFGDRGTLLYL